VTRKRSPSSAETSRMGSRRRAIIRTRILARDGNICYLCLHPMTEDNPPTLEHVIPVSEGGTSEMGNLKLAHFVCNQNKAQEESRRGIRRALGNRP